jgi:hypothetical protein
MLCLYCSSVSIGVTTGGTFCGVVGHKHRHEYSGQSESRDRISKNENCSNKCVQHAGFTEKQKLSNLPRDREMVSSSPVRTGAMNLRSLQ